MNNEVMNNKVKENSVNNDVVGNNLVNNNLVMNESIVVNSNLVVNESTVNNNVDGINGNNNVELSTSENSVANQNSIEEPNYSPVNIVDPGSSSLCASSLDSSDGNLVEPSSSELISSGVADMVMEGVSNSQKRAHIEVSSDGDSVDSSPATVVKSKLPVRKQKGVRKILAPAPPAATPRALQYGALLVPYTRTYSIILGMYSCFFMANTFLPLARLFFSGATFFYLARLFFYWRDFFSRARLFFYWCDFFSPARLFFRRRDFFSPA